jgi:hypothetical protein
VTDNIEQLQSLLTDKKQKVADLQQLVDNAVALRKKQVLEDLKTKEVAFVWQVLQKNTTAISGCVIDIESLQSRRINRYLKTPVMTRTLHFTEPYDSCSTSQTTMWLAQNR